jgi:hypothetical protein
MTVGLGLFKEFRGELLFTRFGVFRRITADNRRHDVHVIRDVQHLEQVLVPLDELTHADKARTQVN